MNIDGDFTGGRILDGVIQQISDGDAQQAGIGLQLRAFHRAVLADVQVVIMGDSHHRGGHVDHRQQGGLLALDVQIVGGEPGVGKAVIGELHQAGGGAADAIEARLPGWSRPPRGEDSPAPPGSPPAGCGIRAPPCP